MSFEYIAGFFDGEGSVHSEKERPIIAIYQATQNNAVLFEIVEFLRQCNIRSNLNHAGPRQTNLKIGSMSFIQIRSVDHAVPFLEAILPYLRVKRVRVLEVLKAARSREFRSQKTVLDRLEKATNDYLSGMTAVKAARKHKTSWKRFSDYMKERGIHIRDGSEAKKLHWSQFSKQERQLMSRHLHPTSLPH